MTVSLKVYKKKFVPCVIPIDKEEEIYHTEIHQPSKDVDTNHKLLQTSKQELTKIFQSKGKTFYIKTSI